MRRLGRRLLWSSTPALFLTACELLVGIPHRDRAEDAGDDASSTAADAPAEGAFAADSTLEAGGADAASSGDAGALDSGGGDDGSATLPDAARDGGCSCPTLGGDVLLCDGFDDGGLAPWVAHATGGSVDIDSTQAQSPPNSLHVVVDQGADASTAAAWAEDDFPPAQQYGTGEVTFDLYIDTFNYGDTLYPVYLGVGNNASMLYLITGGFVKEQEYIYSLGQYGYDSTQTSVGIPQTQWVTVDFVVYAGAVPPTFSLSFAPHGQPLQPQFTKQPFVQAMGWAPGKASVWFGSNFVHDTTERRSQHFDNVVVCAH